MSKLSTHQIRAMIEKVNATIDSHEARPGTARNVAALTRSQARLDSYRAELADREAAERAQNAEQNASQTPPCSQCEGTGSIMGANGSRGCPDCNRTGDELAPAVLAQLRADSDAEDRRRRAQEEAEADEACKLANRKCPTVHTPPKHQQIDGPRRAGISRKRYANAETQTRENEAAANAAKATIRAGMTTGEQRATVRTEPDPELAVRVRDLLRDYTSGTVIDMVWATDREMFSARIAAAPAASDNGRRA